LPQLVRSIRALVANRRSGQRQERLLERIGVGLLLQLGPAPLRDDPSIEDVGKLLSMQLGPDEVLLTAAVRFNRGMRIDEVEAAIERLENAVTAAYPPIRHIYFESGALRSAMR